MSTPTPLATMREISGTLEAAGAKDNPVILGWAREIGQRFPEMAAYCKQYKHDSIAWCGLTMGYVMAHNGIRPPYGSDDLHRFLWAMSWEGWGEAVTGTPQPGDVVVFYRHVTMFERAAGQYYYCRGGNQSDSVNVSRFKASSVRAVRRAPGVEVLPTQGPAISVSGPMLSLGLKGPIVSELQQLLEVPDTGYFDEATYNAVVAFQSAHGLEIDGVVGPYTWQKLLDMRITNKYSDITATVFGGSSNTNPSAYDGHLISDTEFGVALPYRFKGDRPLVQVDYNGRSAVGPIVDVGPWNIDDPYWQTGSRPQAETGVDKRGRTTNLAGIDLTPGLAKSIGLPGKGKVSWWFVGPVQEEKSATQDALEKLLSELRPILEKYVMPVQGEINVDLDKKISALSEQLTEKKAAELPLSKLDFGLQSIAGYKSFAGLISLIGSLALTHMGTIGEPGTVTTAISLSSALLGWGVLAKIDRYLQLFLKISQYIPTIIKTAQTISDEIQRQNPGN